MVAKWQGMAVLKLNRRMRGSSTLLGLFVLMGLYVCTRWPGASVSGTVMS